MNYFGNEHNFRSNEFLIFGLLVKCLSSFHPLEHRMGVQHHMKKQVHVSSLTSALHGNVGVNSDGSKHVFNMDFADLIVE